MRISVDRLLFFVTGFYLLLILGVCFFAWGWGDQTAMGVLLLFGPRWICGIPLLFLIPLSFCLSRRLLIPLLFASIIWLFPIMRFSIPLQFPWGNTSAPSIRVLSYNIGGMTENDYPDLNFMIEQESADIVALQECNLAHAAHKKELFDPHWNIDLDPIVRVCLLSRFPILKKEVRDPDEIWKMSGSGVMTRYHLKTQDGPIYLVNLHLETPREGIDAAIDEWRAMARSVVHLRLGETVQILSEGRWWSPPEMEEKLLIRQYESKVAREWVNKTPHPVLIVGDFNMPTDSGIYRQFWSDFQNAYSKAGFGLGFTKRTRWFGIRIDHILAGPEWKILHSWVGPPAQGSDHVPIVADLSLREG